MSATLKTVTDQTFDAEVLGSPVPVLVDYSAQWCGPCRMVGPLVEQAARDHVGQLTVAQLDIDANPRTPRRYAVRGIPTLMIFRDGRPLATHVGSLSKNQLAAFIAPHVGALCSAEEVAAVQPRGL